MKIYAVTSGCYSEYHIDELFLTKEKAELYIASRTENGLRVLEDDYYIEEFDTYDDNIEGKVYYGIKINKDLNNSSTRKYCYYESIFSSSPITASHRICKSRFNWDVDTVIIPTDESYYGKTSDELKDIFDKHYTEHFMKGVES